MNDASRRDVSRRRFAGIAGSAVVAGSAAAPAAVASPPHQGPEVNSTPDGAPSRPARRRPNILWLVAEDHYPFVGAYGDPTAHTPTLDALAQEGIRYENSYSTAPVCAPSRFALISGVHPQSAAPAQHMRADGRIPAFLRGFPAYLREAGYYCTNNDKTDYNAPFDVNATWDASGKAAHWRNRPANSPFFAVFNDMTTHESALFGAHDGQTRPADVRLPAYLPDTPDIRADFAHYYDAMTRMDRHMAGRLTELETAGLADDTIVFCYSDNGGVLPRSKRHCYDEGMRTALIVRFPEKWAHLAPRPPGSVESRPVTSVDYAPTVLTLAGVPQPEHLQGRPFLGEPRPQPAQYAFGGRDRMDERYDLVRTLRDDRYRYLRNYAPHRPWGQHQAFAWQARGYQSWEQAHLDGTLTPVQNRFWGSKPAEELYDLHTDPDQVHNLATHPAHTRQRQQLSEALDQHILAVHDNGFIPEGSPLEGWDASRREGAYPLERILRLANRAITRDRRQLATFVRELADGNEVVRYWAVQGLLLLGDSATPAAARLTQVLEGDPSPHVRIAAAETLARLDADRYAAQAVGHLGRTVTDHHNNRVRLQALNALTFLEPDTAQLARDAVEQAARDRDEYLHSAGRYLTFVLNGCYTPASPVYQQPLG